MSSNKLLVFSIWVLAAVTGLAIHFNRKTIACSEHLTYRQQVRVIDPESFYVGSVGVVLEQHGARYFIRFDAQYADFFKSSQLLCYPGSGSI